mgnify:CR=1 FL=1
MGFYKNIRTKIEVSGRSGFAKKYLKVQVPEKNPTPKSRKKTTNTTTKNGV